MTQTHTCPHCDSTDAHVHLDSAEYARGRRSRLLLLIVIRVTLLLAGLAALLLGATGSDGLLGLGSGLGLWGVVTAAGVLGGAMAARRLSRLRSLMIGALLAGALTPLAALVVALLGPAPTVGFAAAVALGHYAGAAGAESFRMWRLRTLFGQDTRAGEIARDAATRTRDRDGDVADLIWTLAVSIIVGVWVFLTGLLPVLAVVLVPLHVAIVAMVRRRALIRSAGGPARADSTRSQRPDS